MKRRSILAMLVEDALTLAAIALIMLAATGGLDQMLGL